MKKWLLLLILSLFLPRETIWGAGSEKQNWTGFKSPNSAVTEAVNASSASSTNDNQYLHTPAGVVNNSTFATTASYFYGVFVTSAGSPDATFNVYDTSGNWSAGTKSITGWVHAGNDSKALPMPPINVNSQFGLGYTSSGTVPARLLFLYRER